MGTKIENIWLNNQEGKICSKCKKWRSLKNFTKRIKNGEERGTWCSKCRSSYSKEYTKRPEVRAKAKKYREDPINKIKQRAWQKEYYKIPEVKEKRSKYFKEHNQRPEVKERMLAYSKEHIVKLRDKALLMICENLGFNKICCTDCEKVVNKEKMAYFIHHLDGNGKEHRGNGIKSQKLQRLIIKGVLPIDGFACLCKECHNERHVRGQKTISIEQKQFIKKWWFFLEEIGFTNGGGEKIIEIFNKLKHKGLGWDYIVGILEDK